MIDAGQDASFAGGALIGVPEGLIDTVKGILEAAISPRETIRALKSVLESGDVPGIVSDAMKQSYIKRIDNLQAEYERAGVSGSFNAGRETGKLISELAALATGVGGALKGGALLVEKVTAKVVKVELTAAKEAGEAVATKGPNTALPWATSKGEYSNNLPAGYDRGPITVGGEAVDGATDFSLGTKGPGTSIVPRQGSISFENGKTFESLSVSEQQGLSAIQKLGYDVHVPLEASKKGISGVPTAEFNVQGLGKVDVYAPNNLNPKTISREIEKKVVQGQASSVVVVVPESFSKVDMYKSAAAAFGKSKGGEPIPLNQVIFSQGEKSIQLDRQAINSLLGR